MNPKGSDIKSREQKTGENGGWKEHLGMNILVSLRPKSAEHNEINNYK